MSSPNSNGVIQPIIIKKIKKGGDGHHGGAWKVAYADFVTAMMAFFLLMWLLNSSTKEQKKGIADYFNGVTTVSNGENGAGGVMGGQSVLAPGVRLSDAAPMALAVPMVGAPSAGLPEAEGSGNTAVGGPATGIGAGESGGDKAQIEEQRFDKIEAQIEKEIVRNPELNDLAENVVIDKTPEGLRIQIIDRENQSMFALGSSEMYSRTRDLLASVSKAVDKLPNQVSIRGHTDNRPFKGRAGYSNWELSSDRANATRRALVEAGLDEARVANVVGRADLEPFLPEDPASPRNRRITIVILRDGKLEGGSGQ